MWPCTGFRLQGLISLLKGNALQGVLVCDTFCHQLTGELTSSLFLYSDVLNQMISGNKLIICFLQNYNFRFQEKNSNLDWDLISHFSYPGSVDGIGLNVSLERQSYGRHFGL
jgi:hypothetical protein